MPYKVKNMSPSVVSVSFVFFKFSCTSMAYISNMKQNIENQCLITCTYSAIFSMITKADFYFRIWILVMML